MVTRETVEFLDPVSPDPAPGGPGATAADDDTGGGSAGPRGPRARTLVLALVLAAGTVVAARVLGAPPPAPAAVAAPAPPAPVLGGRVDLPGDFGEPVALVAPTGRGRDEVFALGTGGRVVRIVDGAVAAVSVGRAYTSVAVRPDGGALFASTGRLAPTVVGLDPLSLNQVTSAAVAAPVTALAAGSGSVWAASPAGLQGWTSDLSRPLRLLRLPDGVAAVRSLAVVGTALQGLATTTAGAGALLDLDVVAGARLSGGLTGPLSLATGNPPLLAHAAPDGTVQVLVDPGGPADAVLDRPLAAGASVWSALGVGSARWAASYPGSSTLDCFDGAAQMVGRMSVGDSAAGVRGPVVTTARAVYAVTVDGALGRGGHASCGVPPHASDGGRRGD